MLDCIIHLKCGIRLHEYILVQRLLTLMVLRFHFKQRWYSQLQQSFQEKSECLESVETTEGQVAQFKLGEFYSSFLNLTGGWLLTFLQRNSSGGQLLSGWKQSPLNDCGSDFQVLMWGGLIKHLQQVCIRAPDPEPVFGVWPRLAGEDPREETSGWRAVQLYTGHEVGALLPPTLTRASHPS